MATAPAKLLTAEEFFRLPDPPDGSKQELVRGEVVTMPPPGFRHGDVQLTVGSLLRQFVRSNRIGRVTVESGVITEDDPDTVRGPDVSFWSYERLPADQTPVGYPEVAADLCVEIRSPSNTARKLNEKAGEYLGRGVRMVWVVDPEARTVTVFRKPDEGRLLLENAVVTGEDVLPNFSCRVAEFFE
jgi:Uma2 family endonuclease